MCIVDTKKKIFFSSNLLSGNKHYKKNGFDYFNENKKETQETLHLEILRKNGFCR